MSCRTERFMSAAAFSIVCAAVCAGLVWPGICSGAQEAGPPGPVANRVIPQAGPDHPGNVFLAGEDAVIPPPSHAAMAASRWRAFDDAGRPAAEGALEGDGKPAPLGRLGIGWYRIEFVDSQGAVVGWTTAAVLARLAEPTPQDSPVCLDSASAWFARDDAAEQDHFAHLAALAGANWVRDRMSWGELEPEKGKFAPAATTYDTSADVQSRRGLNTLQVFHTIPSWAADPGLDGASATGRFPRDLRDLYNFCKAMAQRYKGRVQAWEPWNEANIEVFGGHTIDEMCALQKAAYLGFKAGDPGVTVCWNVFAGPGSPLQGEGVLKNEAWPYFETYNIHTYSVIGTYLRGFDGARTAASGRPIWLSECGIRLPFIKESKEGELTRERELQQARFIAPSYVSSMFAGVERHFFFILGNYIENGIQFGVLRNDQTPRPGYVAAAAVGRLLAGAKCLGRIPPENADGPFAYAFRARPEGVERDVLVAWANKPMDLKFPKDMGLPSGRYDYMGRPCDIGLAVDGGEMRVTAEEAVAYFILPAGASAKLKLEAPPPLAPRREGAPSPVVLQVHMSFTGARPGKDAHEVTPGQESLLPLFVYNLSDHPVAGTVTPEKPPKGWRVGLETTSIRLGPFERRPLELRVLVPAKGREALAGDWLTLRGDFGDAGRPVAAFRLIGATRKLEPAASRALPGANAPERWGDNVVFDATAKHAAYAEGGVLFEMRFGNTDPWGFPMFKLLPDEVPARDVDGLGLTVRMLDGQGTLRVQFVEANGASYVADLDVQPEAREPQRAVASFCDAGWGEFSAPDPDGALDPDQIRTVMVGINAKPNSTVKMAVRDLAWVRF